MNTRILIIGLCLALTVNTLTAAEPEKTPPIENENPKSQESTTGPAPVSKAKDPLEEEIVIKMLYSETIVSERPRRGRWSDNTIICKEVTRIGTRFKEERCMSAAEWEFLTKETREGLRNGALR